MSFTVKLLEDQDATITAQYLDSTGDPIDLTGWTLSFRIGSTKERALVEVPVTITAATQGEMQINLTASNTNLPRGRYLAEIARVSPTLGTLVQGHVEIVFSLFGE